MKILVYTTLFPNSEQLHHGIFVEKRLLELRKRIDIDVQVVAPVPWFPFLSFLPSSKRKYARIEKTEVRSNILVHHPRYLVIPKLSWRFAPFILVLSTLPTILRLRRSGFDFALIDAHFFFPDGVAAQIIGVLLGTPVFITARGSDINESPTHFLPRLMIKWALKHVRVVIAVSSDLAQKVRLLRSNTATVETLHNGVDRSKFFPCDPIHLRKSLNLKRRVVLTIGNLRELKGQDIIIRAMAGIKDASLLVVGDGEELENLKQLAQQLGSSDRVVFVGEVENDQLAAYYSVADVFVLASSSEGCPNVVLEAIACGTPVVSTAVGAVPDILPDSCKKFLIYNRTTREFYDRISNCLETPPDKESILMHAQELSWDRTCLRLAEMMRGETTKPL